MREDLTCAMEKASKLGRKEMPTVREDRFDHHTSVS
jgi:hypothetical protein